MNLSSLFPGLGTTPASVGTGGYGYNWVIWIIIILIIVWFGRYSFGACMFGYNYPNYSPFSSGGYPGYPGANPFGNSWWWFIIIILILVWLLGGINRLL